MKTRLVMAASIVAALTASADVTNSVLAATLRDDGSTNTWTQADLTDALGMAVPQSELYVPRYKKHCMTCGSRPICNGCADCGQCRDDWV